MKAPYYRVYLEGKVKRELTDYVNDFSFEDCVLETSMVEFKFFQDKALSVLDNFDIDTGMKVSFQWGFMGEVPSKVHEAIIKDIAPDYSNRGVSLVIRAYDVGIDIKHTSSPKVWKNIRTSDLMTQIAKKYGLNPIIDPTTKVWKSLPQGNKSDVEFAKSVAARETNGNFIVYIRGKNFYCVRRNTKGGSVRTYTWGDGNKGDVISFKPRHKESHSKKGKHQTTLTSIDKITNKAIEHKANDKTLKDNTILGEVTNVYDAINGDVIRQFLDKRIPHPDTANANDKAQNNKKQGDLGIKATLTTIGDVTAEPNTIITIAGTAYRHVGNWLVVKVKHSITNGGYTNTSELLKNGKKINGEKAADKNTAPGPASNKVKVKVAVYDAVQGKRSKQSTRIEDKP